PSGSPPIATVRGHKGNPGFAGQDAPRRLSESAEKSNKRVVGADALTRQATEAIYLVDDDDAVRDSLKLLLESHGMEVRDFDGVAAFLKDYQNGKGACLILDLHLPIVGGLDLIKIMEHQKMTLPVIFITGRSDAQVRARAFEAGATAFLEKPVSEAVLMNAIRAATAGAATEVAIAPR